MTGRVAIPEPVVADRRICKRSAPQDGGFSAIGQPQIALQGVEIKMTCPRQSGYGVVDVKSFEVVLVLLQRE